MLIWHGLSQNHGRSAGGWEADSALKAATVKIKEMFEGLSV